MTKSLSTALSEPYRKNFSMRIFDIQKVYSSYCSCIKKSLGFLALPSLKTILGIFFIEKIALVSRTGSNSLPRSVISYSTLIGYSDTILLLIIPNFWSSRSRPLRTFGVMPSMFSRKRLNCVTLEAFLLWLELSIFSYDFESCFNRTWFELRCCCKQFLLLNISSPSNFLPPPPLPLSIW